MSVAANFTAATLADTPKVVHYTPCFGAAQYVDDFQHNVLPTQTQYRVLCRDVNCMLMANEYLRRIAIYRPVESNDDFRQKFVFPMIDFCYFHRLPSDPCPQDFVAELLVELQPLVDACETKSGFSFVKRPPTVGYDGANQTLLSRLCGVAECDNLMKRLETKQYVETCPSSDDYETVRRELVIPYMKECKVSQEYGGRSRAWDLPKYYNGDGPMFHFIALPGRLPGDPAETPARVQDETQPPSLVPESSPPLPPPTPLAPPTLQPTPSPQPPRNRRSAAPPTAAPTTSKPAITPVSTPRLEIATPSGSGSDSNSIIIRVDSALDRLATNTPTDAPSRAPAGDSTDVQNAARPASTSSSTIVLWSVGAAAVVVLLLLLVILVRRRHRRSNKLRDGYQSFDSDGRATDTSSVGPEPAPLLGVLVPCATIQAHELEELTILGGGGYGVVYLVRETPSQRLLASKRINKDNHTKDQLDAFVGEINMAASLSHPLIVSFVGVAGRHKHELQALFEFMEGGDLKRYLDDQPPVDVARHSWTREKLQIAVDVAEALAYLHTLQPTPVVHRDLKSRNIMLTKERRAKIGDFGASRCESVVGSMTTGVGTSRWVAPEVIVGGGDYTTACDVYSFGVVLTELDTHRMPFWELDQPSADCRTEFAVLVMVATHHRQPSLSGTCPRSIRELAQQCLAFEPERRPAAGDIAASLRHIQQEIKCWEGRLVSESR